MSKSIEGDVVDRDYRDDIIGMLRAQIRLLGHMPCVVENREAAAKDKRMEKDLMSELSRLRTENERLLASMRIVRNDLAALVPVPSADEPQWPEFFSDVDYECLTLALREARAAVELSKEPSNG